MDGAVAPAVAKALARFAETVASGATYEAQQVLKTVYHRLRSRGQLQQSYDLAARAAVTQFGAHQPTCGAELGIMMLTDFVTDGVQVAPAPLQLAMAVLDAPSPSDADELISLAKATLKWIVSCGGTRADAAQVHDAVAQRVCDAKGLAAATPFFVRATSLVPFAAAVQAAAREGLPQEQGLFFLRAVLQALLACDHVTEEGVARCAPLLNAFDGCEAPAAHLARLLLVAVTPGKADRALFKTLSMFYAGAHSADASLQPMIDRIESAAFSSGAGGIGGLLDALIA